MPQSMEHNWVNLGPRYFGTGKSFAINGKMYQQKKCQVYKIHHDNSSNYQGGIFFFVKTLGDSQTQWILTDTNHQETQDYQQDFLGGSFWIFVFIPT